MKDFNKHMITGPRLTAWKMVKAGGSLSDGKLVPPCIFGTANVTAGVGGSTTAYSIDSINDYGIYPNAFQSHDVSSAGRKKGPKMDSTHTGF